MTFTTSRRNNPRYIFIVRKPFNRVKPESWFTKESRTNLTAKISLKVELDRIKRGVK